jgi:hypothetical protein
MANGINIDPQISLGAKPPAVMSLPDMLNLARGAQAYQQAQQLNPVELERAMAERDVAVGTAKPRIQRATVEADEATLGLEAKILSHTRSEIAELVKKKDLTFKDVEQAIIRTASLTNAPEEVRRNAITKALADFSPNATAAELRSTLAGQLVKTTSAEQQLASRFPKPETLETGGTKLPVAAGNELVTGVTPGQQVGIGYTMTPPPQFQQTETGLVGQFGGGPSATIAPPPSLFSTQPPAAPAAPMQGAQATQPAQTRQPAPARIPPAPTSPAARASQGTPQGPLQIMPGETVDAYRARIAEVAKLPRDAAEVLNPKNVESIPTMEYTNDRILKLLENPNLKIGPISKAIADRTGGVGLSAEQQEIQKYLEQRIRQEGSRSNQDQESQRMSFGNFGTNKDALRTIIYNDKAILAAQRLFYEGVKKAQGNPNSPNLPAINVFREKFNELAGDRDLMHYIGIVGNKSFDKLSQTDKNQLRIYFAGKSQDPGKLFDDLEGRRAELLKLVRGGN